MSQISINPLLTTNAAGSFQTQSLGYIQGVALDDPSIRNELAGGYLDSAETLPMWGGVAIEELTGLVGESRGNDIKRAVGYTTLTGFSVFNQNHAGINTPQSPVPLTPGTGLVNFYRLGSGARIALAIDPTLIGDAGQIITQQLSWDFTAQQIVAFSVTALNVRVLEIAVGNSMTVSYDAGTGFATWNKSGAVAIVLI